MDNFNKWIKKSINLANSRAYLDKLFNIYPIEAGTRRNIPTSLKEKIKDAFKEKNKANLIKALLKLSRFPIDDPYIASIRRHHHLLNKNPRTIERIGERLLLMDINNILDLSAQPKSPSRQFGQSFKKWLTAIRIPFLEEKSFITCDKIAFLNGSDSKLKQFAIRNLKIKNLKRRPDFVLKIKNKFIIGESKFLTDYGGTQNNQFDGALTMAKIKNDKVMGVAILDGIIWFESNAYMHKTIKKFNGAAMSALLLKEFIKKQL